MLKNIYFHFEPYYLLENGVDVLKGVNNINIEETILEGKIKDREDFLYIKNFIKNKGSDWFEKLDNKDKFLSGDLTFIKGLMKFMMTSGWNTGILCHYVQNKIMKEGNEGLADDIFSLNQLFMSYSKSFKEDERVITPTDKTNLINREIVGRYIFNKFEFTHDLRANQPGDEYGFGNNKLFNTLSLLDSRENEDCRYSIVKDDFSNMRDFIKVTTHDVKFFRSGWFDNVRDEVFNRDIKFANDPGEKLTLIRVVCKKGFGEFMSKLLATRSLSLIKNIIVSELYRLAVEANDDNKIIPNYLTLAYLKNQYIKTIEDLFRI